MPLLSTQVGMIHTQKAPILPLFQCIGFSFCHLKLILDIFQAKIQPPYRNGQSRRAKSHYPSMVHTLGWFIDSKGFLFATNSIHRVPFLPFYVDFGHFEAKIWLLDMKQKIKEAKKLQPIHGTQFRMFHTIKTPFLPPIQCTRFCFCHFKPI